MSTLVMKPAPEFTARTVMADDSVREDFSSKELEGKYWFLFFYPFDFSHVCPTEMLALDERLEEFQGRDCEVVGISVDSVYSHSAWKRVSEDDGGIGPIRFPLVSDLDKSISRDYGVLVDDAISLRATFLVDRTGMVRHATINDLDLGRNVQEMLRTLDAVRHIDETGNLCPANWDGTKDRGKPLSGVKKKVQSFDLGSA
jgi:peroxiredoxin (alkyl hydroperoxide reductase subunit C)